MRGSRSIDLARLKKEERKTLAVWLLSGSVLLRCFSAPLGVLLAIKTLEDGWYILINAYTFTVFVISILIYCHIACLLSLHVRVYRL